ncbi:SpaH/EbpB family LPXTG-anchored major pilin [Blautia sp. MSJ-19]|uniref:SpaH/EbpB family LPXTG-anchored major pilin n=1 Tax=Blautia sp. MSJ-19 TaxID=2841517 RepID=UPI001C0F14B7|nr:SpaH/EbpB family LPXTG-anchored major pilin [Blautia sp. MSJ-19]MBU5482286.1 SpaH/EbpB family LPXTG-anchored major pilin [Blautia sp. MSJ-19]
MKKFKKLLAGLLAGAMMLGSMSATAFAADATEPVPTATIDYTKKGSLTLYKYYFKNTQPDGLTEGTGETEGIPAGATALEGAEFSIWRVADIDGNVTIDGKTDQKFDVTGVKDTDVATAKGFVGDKPADAVQTTDSTGKAVFGKSDAGNTLELGYYYVKETKTPANISSTPAEFVVSVPMTNKKTDAGTKWIYDVTVYPKNVKTEAGVTIKKVNAAGADISANAKFVLQKKASDNTWKYVSYNDTTKAYNYEVASLGDATQFGQGAAISGLGNGSYRLFEVSADYGYIMDGTIAYEFDIANNGEITKPAANSGNYLSYVKDGEADNKKSAIITVKNERPDLEKKVKENNTWQDDADTAAGKEIEYRVKVSVPGNIAKLNTFKITDTPEHIKDDVDTVKLYSDEACTQEIANLTKDTDYTITATGDGFVLDFINAATDRVTDAFATNYANQNIYVYYKATLKDDAISTVDGNPNTVKLDYSNGIYPTAADEPNSGKDQDHAYIEDKAVVYTFKFTIKKTDKDGTPLIGADFVLYKCDAEGLTSETEIKKGTLIKEWKDAKTATFEADKLEAGYYYVIETKAPEGYNLLTKPVEIKELNVQYATTWTTSSEFTKDADGVWHLVKCEKTSTTFTYDQDASHKGLEFTGEQTIVNKKGFTLPVTGGMGTITITVLGIALVFAGVLIIGASRKKTAK